MESKDKKYLKLVEGLKSSNISSNIVSLHVSSEQIELLLNQIDKSGISVRLSENLKNSIDVIKKTTEDGLDTNTLINMYIKFGDIYRSMLCELLEKKYINEVSNIGVQYLNIAKQTKDTRIKNIALSIAKEISAVKENQS